MWLPRASRIKSGSPPTLLKARTGLFTPPGISARARRYNSRDRSVFIEIPFSFIAKETPGLQHWEEFGPRIPNCLMRWSVADYEGTPHAEPRLNYSKVAEVGASSGGQGDYSGSSHPAGSFWETRQTGNLRKPTERGRSRFRKIAP